MVMVCSDKKILYYIKLKRNLLLIQAMIGMILKTISTIPFI